MGPMATVITSAAAGSLINLAAPSSGICIRDLGITGNCTNAISDNNVSNMGFALIDNVNIEGTGFTISNGIVFSGSGLGGYWNRINNCRINNVGNAIVLNGSNALNAVLRDIDIGGGNIGVNAVGDAAAGTFFVMENVQCNSCTNIGFAATNCSFSANNCIMDGCGNYATNLFYNSISGMPSIGYYVNMTHTWSNFSQNTNPGVGNFIGSGMVVDTTALSTIKLTINLASCRCEENKFTGLVLNGNTSSPTNLRASVTGCVFIQNNIGNTTTPINGEGAYFSACKVSAVGNHMTDNLTGAAGMFLTANSSGAVIGNIGVNNPGGTVINNGTAVTTGNS
jgi:hypothetical protein